MNDPGAWGSASPAVIVLGFSKGFTQANAFRGERFEDVPFKKIRHRLDIALRKIGIIASPDTSESFDLRFEGDEKNFAFGSLVRCSLSRLNRKTGKYECTGQIMTQAFREPAKEIVRTCAERYLRSLPSSVKVAVLLGTSDAYIKSCRSLIRSLNPSTFSDINPVAYRAAG
ncbi:hypothetical protein [Acetobacter persici]|uniref:hypothetical protein n=1 Tax=Acetobacter persici TaxID=1076596 RepID=UPI0012FE1936|nr:hypothetical protein [Acetobacter persici]